jgi:hypothetical protein
MGLSWQTSYGRTTLERLGGFDEEFRSYGWEDIEFSFRASQQGLRFYYEPAAVSLHRDQRYTLQRHAERLRSSARMAPLLFERHPALRRQIGMYADKGPVDWAADRPPVIVKKGLRRLFSSPPLLRLLKDLTPWVERLTSSPAVLRRWYYAVLSHDIDAGYRQGLAEYAAAARPAPAQPNLRSQP